jgi:Peptidase family M28
MGSVRFFEHQRDDRGFHAAVVMDLVGHDVPLPLPALKELLPRFGSLLFVTGAESHPALADIVRHCRRDPELPIAAARNRLVGDLSDHHVFRINGVPYLFLSCGRWPHYHQPTDTPDRLNYDKMARIRAYLLCLTGELAASELPPTPEADTTGLEITLLKEALGPGLAALLGAAGLTRLETRQDMDALASRLQTYFGL